MEAKTGVREMQAKECPRLPATTRSWGERHGQILPHCLQKEPTLRTP